MDGYREFVRRLVREELPTPSAAELNALLHWLAGRSNEATVLIQRGFDANGIPLDLARLHTLNYLDYTLFCHRNDYYRLFGLSPDCKLADIRTRHKQLLQIFHPDRHTENRDWFTERTEQLNLAYAHLKSHHDDKRSANAPPRGATIKPAAPRKQPVAVASKSNWWRLLAANKAEIRKRLKSHLGRPAVFERRLYILLWLIPLLLLGLVYLDRTAPTRNEQAALTVDRAKAQSKVRVGETTNPEASRQASAPATVDRDGQPLAAGKPSMEAELSDMPPEETWSAKSFNKPPPLGDAATVDRENRTIDELSARSVDTRFKELLPAFSSATAQGTGDGVASLRERLTDNLIEPQSGADPVGERNSLPAGEKTVVEDARGWRYEFQRPPRSGEAVPPGRTHVNDLIAVKTMVNRYQIAYNFSNIDGLGGLFHHDAVNGKAKGRSQITQAYKALFQNTSERKIVIRDALIEQTGDRTFNVVLDFSLDLTHDDGIRKSGNGRMRLHVVMMDDNPRILRLESLAGSVPLQADVGCDAADVFAGKHCEE